jgi:acid phosphatase family membrane protein YuiD
MCMQIFTKKMKQGIWDLRAIVDSGGMPSSHSALCTVRPRPCGASRDVLLLSNVIDCHASICSSCL